MYQADLDPYYSKEEHEFDVFKSDKKYELYCLARRIAKEGNEELFCDILCEAYIGDYKNAHELLYLYGLDEANVYAFLGDDDKLNKYLIEKKESASYDDSDH